MRSKRYCFAAERVSVCRVLSLAASLFAAGVLIPGSSAAQSASATSTNGAADTTANGDTSGGSGTTSCSNVPFFNVQPPLCPILFAGINFLSVHNRADTATISNGVVRVSADQNVTYGAGGAFPIDTSSIRPLKWLSRIRVDGFEYAPIIGGIASTNGGTIGSMVIGYTAMFPPAFLGTAQPNAQTHPHFGVAAALSLTFNVQTLADGFSPNQPPPPGVTQVGYKSVTAPGFMLMFTYIP